MKRLKQQQDLDKKHFGWQVQHHKQDSSEDKSWIPLIVNVLEGILALHMLLEAEDTSHGLLIHGNSLGWRVKAEFPSNLFGQRQGLEMM
ncbi:hypothetical protein HPP92_011302 [Vanilla planifolia]|uniref:Uncharacterized protein n=1 Tax=Vanilla planifolia TaxID=51239 RepID=A0A835V3D4_VANPL|nr:hypothetical protein HPP92_011609 [Vanilla planifolia]KAG0483218.1 hypothetical protein HPP92_011302 [Vanilla planifolia]